MFRQSLRIRVTERGREIFGGIGEVVTESEGGEGEATCSEELVDINGWL